MCSCQSSCQICYCESNLDNNCLLLNNYDVFCKNCLSKWISSLNLSIDIELADIEEWVQTGREDTYSESNTIRLRNPKTNLPFKVNELEQIYNFLT